MTATDRKADTDDTLVDEAHQGDFDALDELLERHLHPAWRIALVAAPDVIAAEGAVVDGFCDALVAARRHPDATLALRERVVATTRRKAAAGAGPGRRTPTPGEEPVLAAFLVLPEAWRTAIWLSEVEGGTPEQTSTVLGVDRSAAAALTDRATAGLRDRLAADVAERAESPECARVLQRLPALAAGKMTSADRLKAQVHFASCGSCSLWLAALVAPRPALRRLVPPLPTDLAPAVAARWAQVLDRERKAWLAPWTERAIGAAAAAVLAVGLAGVALIGGRDRGDQRVQFATPSAATNPIPPSSGAGESAAGSLPAALGTASGTTGVAAAGNATTGSVGGVTGSAGRPSTRTSSTPSSPGTPSRPQTPTTPSNPSRPANPMTPAARGPDPVLPPAPTPPPADNPEAQVSIGVGDAVQVGLGDCTGANVGGTGVGCDPQTTGPVNVVVDLPGLPPIVL